MSPEEAEAAPLVACAVCGELDDRRLYGRLARDVYVDAECWRNLGRPWPHAGGLPPSALGELEAATRRRMLRRGGSDAHLVRKGIS